MSKKLALQGGDIAVTKKITAFNPIRNEEKLAALKTFDNGPLSGFYGSTRPEFFGGPEVRAFEAEWCQRFNCAFTVSVNSATSGLIAAMGAIGISPGDEVILPPYTMSATAIAPIIYGAIPVFADVEDQYFCIDPIAVKALITEKTRAIIAVNLFGHPAQLHALRKLADEHGLFLIEDNAQAVLAEEQGALTGSIGHIGVYSLNVHKHIQTGEGGMCVTNDEMLAKKLQIIRNHGENVTDWLEVSDLNNMIGFNFRMLEMSAAVGRVQLQRVDELVERCEYVATRLTAGIKGLKGMTPPAVRDKCRHNYFMWTCLFDEAVLGVSREIFVKAVRAEGVPLGEGYVKPLYLLPMFQKRMAVGRNGYPFSLSEQQYESGLCPVVEDLHFNRVFQIQPVSWNLDNEQIDMVIDAFHKVHSNLPILASIAASAEKNA